MKGLNLGNNEHLIAIAWCTNEQKLFHRKLPFILGYDETFFDERREALVGLFVWKVHGQQATMLCRSVSPVEAKVGV